MMVYRSTSTYLGLGFRLGSLTHTAGYAAFTFTQAIMKDNPGGYLKMYWIPHLLKGTPKEEASNHYEFFPICILLTSPCKTAPSKFEFTNIFSQRNYNSFLQSLEMFVAMPQLELPLSFIQTPFSLFDCWREVHMNWVPLLIVKR